MQLPDPLRRTIWGCRALVWLASWLVPRGQRREWRALKSDQLWHWCHFLAESGQLSREKKLELATYCWGLVFEAFWARYEREGFLRRVDQVRRAPATCLTVIVLLLVAIIWGGGFIPFARSLFSFAVSDPERVCIVSLNGKFRRFRSETLLDLTSAWKTSKFLDAVAPYSWGPGKLAAGKRMVPILSARVAPDFFDILGVKATLGRAFESGDGQSCPNCVVLSNELWALQFKSSPDAIGRRIVVDGNEKIVIGVLPRNFRLVSSGIGVWTLLDSASPPFTNFVERIGAVALMKPEATEARVESDLTDLSENAGYIFPASLLVVTSAKARDAPYSCLLLLVPDAGDRKRSCDRVRAPPRRGVGRRSAELGSALPLVGLLCGEVCAVVNRRLPAGLGEHSLPGGFHGWIGLSDGGWHGLVAVSDSFDCSVVMVPSRSAKALPCLLAAAGYSDPDRRSGQHFVQLVRNGNGLLQGPRRSVLAGFRGQVAGGRSLEQPG